MVDLSSEFFTLIPHRIGRSRKQIQEAIIDTLPEFEEKQTTLQLMKDMLTVNGEGGDVLFKDEVDAKFEALGVELVYLSHSDPEFKQMAEYVVKSQVKTKHIKVSNVYKVKRPKEWATFEEKIGNHKLLFHGSRIQNWVGLLTRGILLPKIVVSMGVNRTDAGWLGNGIYLGDAACTSLFYTTPGKRKTRFMCVARTALGKVKDFTKITYGLNAPPAGYDSCHGVRSKAGVSSQFADDEFVIYRTEQQRMEYLVEFTG
jgi:poly [ADP-ribose] polymerase